MLTNLWFLSCNWNFGSFIILRELELPEKWPGDTFFKGARKSFFMHYSCVVIILFNTGLHKSVFSTYSFGKLVFCLSALFVFSSCSEFDVIFINYCNICIIIIDITGVRYSVFLFSLMTSNLSNLWEQIHITKTWLQHLIKNMFPGSFSVLPFNAWWEQKGRTYINQPAAESWKTPVCHSYVLVSDTYVTRMWFYHEPTQRHSL